MNYRFLSSITDSEVADFRNRLAAELATRMTDDGKRVISDETIGQEVNRNISTEEAKKYLQSNDAEHYDYAQLADVIAAKYRTFGQNDIKAFRDAIFQYYTDHAKKYDWGDVTKEANFEAYEALTDDEIVAMLKRGEDPLAYAEMIVIYG